MARTDEERFIAGLRDAVDYVQGGGRGDERLIVPEEVDVQAIRRGLGLSQHEFALRYGFPVGTVRNWEQGRRRPEGAARLLLEIIRQRPQVVEEVLRQQAG